MNIWFTSDLHGWQKNICSGSTSWKNKGHCRPFENEDKMTDILINNINNKVAHNDILYCLGDWSFGGRENIARLRNRINCSTIHLVLGNHDDHIRNNAIIPLEKGFINAQNLFTSCHEILEKKIAGQNMVLCHYSFRVWHKGSKGSWMLFGHSHGNLPSYGNYNTMDVGVDTHSEFRPYHIDEIRRIFKNKENLLIDHHK